MPIANINFREAIKKIIVDAAAPHECIIRRCAIEMEEFHAIVRAFDGAVGSLDLERIGAVVVHA